MKKIVVFLFMVFICRIPYAQTEIITFESNTPNLYIDSVTGVWQIGTPSKTIFNSAHSLPFALITDTLNPYGNNLDDAAYFTIIPGSAMMGGFILSFKYKIDTYLNDDYGVLEVFDEDVMQWTDIHYQSSLSGMPSGYHFQFTLTHDNNNIFYHPNGNMVFSGTNNAWQNYSAIICPILLLPPLEDGDARGGTQWHFRFRFVSDVYNTNKEGWMIDDISFQSYSLCPSSINENSLENLISVYPNPSTGIFTIQIEDVQSIKNNIQCKVFDISGKELINTPIQSRGAEVNLSHLQNGVYFLQIETLLGLTNKKIILAK